MTDLAFRSAVELAQLVRDRATSATELVQLYSGRIESLDRTLNAVVVRDFDAAREQARVLDGELEAGTVRGPLHGVPLTVKESYDVAGLPTTWGIRAFEKNVPSEDAAVVRRLRSAGAIVLGKTNVPVACSDYQSYNDLYGTTCNPWDLSRTPGGSSGGSAAALAAGFSALECGSDLAGSIRLPAHFCGVLGHKPTYGIVPAAGHALPGSCAEQDLVVCGPMARSARDLELALTLLAGPEPRGSSAWRLPLPRPRWRALSELRVAVWPSHDLSPPEAAIAARVSDVGARLARLGAKVSDQARPEIDVEAAHATYLSLMMALNGAALPESVYRQLQEQAPQIDPHDRSRRSVVRRAAVMTHRDWLRHHEQRCRIRAKWAAFFREWDVLLCPAMTTTAFPHDHTPFEARMLKIDGEMRSYHDQSLWSGLATAAYLPSTVFPTGLSREGLPIGVQAIGPELSDLETIQVARLYAQELGGFERPSLEPVLEEQG